MDVLFIEDDSMNRRVVRDMLGVAGAVMVEAEDAETGLRLIDERDFAMVLVDLRMPGMDGITAIRLIRTRGDTKARIPIVAVTADTAPDLRAQCIEAGADEVIFKPVAMEALFEAMGEVLARGAREGRLID